MSRSAIAAPATVPVPRLAFGLDPIAAKRLVASVRAVDLDQVIGCGCAGEDAPEHELGAPGCSVKIRPRRIVPFGNPDETRAAVDGSFRPVAAKAAGTCPDCARPGIKVATRTVWGVSPDHRPEGHPLGLTIELVEHATRARGGAPCTGAGKLPAGLAFTPSAEVTGWVRSYGAASVAVR